VGIVNTPTPLEHKKPNYANMVSTWTSVFQIILFLSFIALFQPTQPKPISSLFLHLLSEQRKVYWTLCSRRYIGEAQYNA
jgi:hypothetical protein